MARLAVLASAALVAACSHGTPTRTFEDPQYHWTLVVPPAWRAERFAWSGRLYVAGGVVSNFEARGGFASPYRRPPRVPADGVAVEVWHREGGPLSLSIAPRETPLPLRASAFRRAYPVGAAVRRYASIDADGVDYTVETVVGPDASAADRKTLEQVVRSLRFPHVRTGQAVGRFVALAPARTYPRGSITPVHAAGRPYFLVHAPRGFYTLDARVGGCRLRRVAAGLRCARNRWTWNRFGARVAPASADWDTMLDSHLTRVGWDGHVLVAPGATVRGPRILAQRYG